MPNATAPVKKRGVLIAVKQSTAFKLHEVICDLNGRFIIVICDMNNSTYTLVNLYASNKGQKTLLRSLLKRVDKLKRGSLLLCGDFNIVNKTMDCSSPNPTNRQELQPFKRKMICMIHGDVFILPKKTLPIIHSLTGRTQGLTSSSRTLTT